MKISTSIAPFEALSTKFLKTMRPS